MNCDLNIDDMNDIELTMLAKKLAKRTIYLQYITALVGILGIAVLSLIIYELIMGT